MYDFYLYKQKKRYIKPSVIQTDISHFKTVTMHFRADEELRRNIIEFSIELKQDKSKIIRDILMDFFLERNHKAWLKEVSEW